MPIENILNIKKSLFYNNLIFIKGKWWKKCFEMLENGYNNLKFQRQYSRL